MNNHLYSSIQLEFSLDEDWDNVEAVSDGPFLPLTENDLKTIDEDDDDQNRSQVNTHNNAGNIKRAYETEARYTVTEINMFILRWTRVRKRNSPNSRGKHFDTNGSATFAISTKNSTYSHTTRFI